MASHSDPSSPRESPIFIDNSDNQSVSLSSSNNSTTSLTPRQLEEQQLVNNFRGSTIRSQDDEQRAPLRITFENLVYKVKVKRTSLKENIKACVHNVKRKRRHRLMGSTVEPHSTNAAGQSIRVDDGDDQHDDNLFRDPMEDDAFVREKIILHGISGVFWEGRLTAIMGSSGAGKTTLLNVLAGNIDPNATLTGSIYVNSESVHGTRRMKEISGFVFQDDLLLQTMTVKEAIHQSVLLRSPRSMSEEQRMQRERRALRIFRLGAAANTKVGTPDKKGISGGERKRTAIAMEVAINPSMLFLDEPTSGLDTFTAYTVIKILHGLTRRGHTVITTIHQPSSEIFHLFDDLMILAHGRVLYHGPANNAVSYFAKLGYVCPQFTNPADYFFMQVIQGVDIADQEAEEEFGEAGEQMEDLTNEKRQSQLRKSTAAHPGRDPDPDMSKIQKLLIAWQESPENTSMQRSVHEPLNEPVKAYRYQASFWTQFTYLLGRASKNAIRNPLIIRVRMIQTVAVSVFVGLSFYNVSRLTPQQQIQNTAGVLFFIALNQFFTSATSVMTIFSREKYVFFREYGAGYYCLEAYYLSKILVEIPYQIIFPALFVLILYYIVGLKSGFSNYLYAALFAILCALNGTAIGTLVASIFEDLTIALAVLPIILLPLILYSGFLLNGSTLPGYLLWIRYISPTQYAVTGLFENQFSGNTLLDKQALAAFSLQNALPSGVNVVFMCVIYVTLVILSYIVLFIHIKRRRL